MAHEEAIAELKTHLEEELQSRGINTKRHFRCLNPNHEDKNPSMSYDPNRQRAKCFSCEADYDVIDVLGLDHGYTDEHGIEGRYFKEVLKEACDRFNIDLDSPTSTGEKSAKPQKARRTEISEDQKAQQQEAEAQQKEKAEKAHRQIQEARRHIEDPEALAYLQKRGISLETAKAHGLGYLPSFYTSDGATWRALVIPTSEASLLARNVDADQKGRKAEKRGQVSIFNLQAIYEAETVHLCEGEIDALSVCEVGGAAIGLGSASYAKRFIEELKQALVNPSKPLKVKTLILCLDNDEEGLKAAQNVRDGINDLKKQKLTDIRLKTIDIAQPYKDPNEALIADRAAFTEAVKKRATDAEIEAYATTSAGARLLDFIGGINDSVNTPAIPTGFRYLDKELDGGLYEGLYILAAITSLGKTTLALQMADNIAAAGYDVLYVSLEMAESELIARSISRQTLTIAAAEGINRNSAKSVRGITDGKRYEYYLDEERTLINKAYEAYAAYADNLYIREGLGDIGVKEVKAFALKHKDVTGRTPVIFIDYVQILSPADIRATDKQNIDKAALELKRLSRDLKTPVIAISSLNRANYRESINLAALKESGALEYGADVVIGLQLQGAGTNEANTGNWLDNRMKEDPRAIEAKILKNRNGRRGESLYFDYYPVFNLFDEQEEPRHYPVFNIFEK